MGTIVGQIWFYKNGWTRRLFEPSVKYGTCTRARTRGKFKRAALGIELFAGTFTIDILDYPVYWFGTPLALLISIFSLQTLPLYFSGYKPVFKKNINFR